MRVANVRSRSIEAITESPSAGGMTELLSMIKSLLVLSKPGIVIAELLAGLAGAMLASPHPEPLLLCQALLCIAMAAAGSAMVNCLIEEESDRKMKRLAKRNNALEKAGRWLVWRTSCFLLFGAALMAVNCFRPEVTILLAVAVIGYTVLYTTWLKHRTPWSVLAGGIPGALPPLIGAAAVSSAIPKSSLLLGALIYLWQLPHFWLLALQHIEEYRLAGIPVLPLSHGYRTTGFLTMAASAALVPLSLIFSLSAGHEPSFAVMLAAAYCYFIFLVYRYLYISRDYSRGFTLSILLMNGTLLAAIGNALLRSAK